MPWSSCCSDFPTPTDELLLSLAANHAATAFQTACAEEALRQTRNELETKVAERTAELGHLAEEQAALRRVATLVARGAPAQDLFAAVVEEVGRLLPAGSAAMGRYDPDGMFTTVAAWSTGEVAFPAGGRWAPEGKNLTAMVLRTGRPARLDGFSDASGPVGVHAREAGYRSAVGCPITVEGRLWGVMTAASTAAEPLPADTEARLTSFTELLATAIANAESRSALARLAEEQAALRHVAVLVARQPSPDEIFTAVTEAVGPLLGADLAAMHTFPGDGTATVIAGWSAQGPILPIGTRLPLDGDSVASRIFETGAAARMDGYEDVEGETAEVARGLRLRSTVGAPILVGGKLWGSLMAATRGVEPLPEDAETRIAAFTELVATAVSNAQARDDLRRLAEEQAALRRVATLVAKEESPIEVFAKVAEEAGGVLGNVDCGLVRDDGDGNATVVAAWGDAISASFPLGTRMPVDGEGVVASVLREGGPHRIDDYSAARGVLAEGARERGIGSAVGCPVVVRGEIWGALVVATSGERPCPPETERRIEQFADLVATAVANADARAEVERLADEQAALRRVATLVASQAAAEEIFAAVAEETARLLAAERAAVTRFEARNAFTVLAYTSSDGPGIPTGTELALDGDNVVVDVWRHGRPARREEIAHDSGSAVEYRRTLDPLPRSTVGAPIVVDRRIWGAIFVSRSRSEPLPATAEQHLVDFSKLVATAIANAQGREELSASRRRIVAASDEARRQIERDLHDGTQQRLVSLGLAVRAAEANVPPDQVELRSELSRIATELSNAVGELQEISRGIHPAILAQGGLGPALRTLARRSAIPVELDIRTETRLPSATEVAAYYVVSEALANAVKHAQASRIDISLAPRNGRLLLSIRDDGIGGADPTRGSGLVGLADRVEALGGSISVESGPGDGTEITAELPLELKVGEESSQGAA